MILKIKITMTARFLAKWPILGKLVAGITGTRGEYLKIRVILSPY